MQRYAVILAAGKGTRMKSELPKVLHEAAFHPILHYVLTAAESVSAEKILTVIGHGAEQVKAVFGGRTEFVLQREQKGTGHAVMEAMPALAEAHGTVLILCGDTPLLRGETLDAFLQAHEAEKAACSVLTANIDNPFGYGRIIRGADGALLKIVEQRDATPEEQAVTEINSGVYCFDLDFLREAVKELKTDNDQGEFYLTDTVAICNGQGKKALAWIVEDFEEVKGINDRKQLSEAGAILFRRKNEALMAQGVTMISPENTFVDPEAEVGCDTVLEPFCTLRGKVKIGKGCTIGPRSELKDSTLGDGVRFWQSIAVEATLGDDCNIGPFAYLRPQTALADQVKVGDFVEVKNSSIGQGSKLPHLAYIGDSDVGSGVNIACGTITCNYDGFKKYRSTIGNHVFVGCNANLVSPVTVEDGAYIAAGSTVTKNVPADSLAVAREKQKNIEGWARSFRSRHKDKE